MRYLYLFLEIILYAVAAILYFKVFARYKFRPLIERKLENEIKTPVLQDILFFSTFIVAIAIILIVWYMLFPGQFHHIGYFFAFLPGSVFTLAIFRRWVRRIDLALCLPAMLFVWFVLLLFESILLANHAGWVYTDSTVYTVRLGPDISLILENLIFFYLISPFISIVLFSGLTYDRSDISAFFLTNLIMWIGGVLWEYIGIALFNLWYLVESRSVLAFNLLGARITIEEILYYVPFVSISILIYQGLYIQKYRKDLRVKPSRDE
jgi:hypothetical protein